MRRFGIRPQRALPAILLVFVALFACSGSAPSAAGELESWFAGLPFPALGTVAADQFLLVVGVISGQLAAAGFVIAAKGLLRFPEIRAQSEARIDEVTEYFLIGTFASVIVAATVSLFVLASF